MSWERRRNRRYYYRARRVDGRVVKAYVGAGPMAELAAARDEATRAEHSAARARQLAEQRRLVAADCVAADADLAASALLEASVVAAGFHRHHRGEWRRRRDG